MAVELSPDEVIIGSADGPGLYVAAPGTAMPTDLDNIDVEWSKLGYLNEDGPTLNQEVETDSITPWQGKSPIKSFVLSREFTIGFVLIQVNSVTVSMWFDQPDPGETAGNFTMDIRDDVPQREYGILLVIRDGSERLAIQFENGTLSEAGEMPFKKEGATEFPITLSATSDSGLVGQVKKETITP